MAALDIRNKQTFQIWRFTTCTTQSLWWRNRTSNVIFCFWRLHYFIENCFLAGTILQIWWNWLWSVPFGNHCAKSVRIRSYSGPYFPAFGLNTERYRISLCMQSEYGKIRTRLTLNTNVFHAVNGNMIQLLYFNA